VIPAPLRAAASRVAGSLWFLPALMVLAGVGLAILLVGVEPGVDLGSRWPRIFGAGADGARSMLSAIAQSMITVAGVIFSVTIVALSNAASQYSPRVLRTFLADRPTRFVLGTFVGVFAYCLTVLRTIRGGDHGAFVPSIAVLAGFLLAFAGIGVLIYFIHHIAASIQAAEILGRITAVTLRAVDRLFPNALGEPAEGGAAFALLEDRWAPLAACASGYLVSVDEQGLLAFAAKRGRVLRMERGIGEFVIEGTPLASLQGREPASEADAAALNRCYAFDSQRSIEQDAAFGLQQLVDVGVKALSPGINDTTSALMCIDRLTEILVRLARRRIESPLRRDGGEVRVVAIGASFASLLEVAYAQILDNGRGKRIVLERLEWSVAQVLAATRDPERRAVLGGWQARFTGANAAAS
jgi:uncharacterized membrane protein